MWNRARGARGPAITCAAHVPHLRCPSTCTAAFVACEEPRTLVAGRACVLVVTLCCGVASCRASSRLGQEKHRLWAQSRRWLRWISRLSLRRGRAVCCKGHLLQKGRKTRSRSAKTSKWRSLLPPPAPAVRNVLLALRAAPCVQRRHVFRGRARSHDDSEL